MTEADIDFTWNGATIPIVNADSETETGAKMYPIFSHNEDRILETKTFLLIFTYLAVTV